MENLKVFWKKLINNTVVLENELEKFFGNYGLKLYEYV